MGVGLQAGKFEPEKSRLIPPLVTFIDVFVVIQVLLLAVTVAVKLLVVDETHERHFLRQRRRRH